MARPRKPIEVDEVHRLAVAGLSRRQICAALGISEDTLARRAKEDDAFEAALATGRAQGIAEVAEALHARACAGDVRAQVFYLRACAGWRMPPDRRYAPREAQEDADARYTPSWPAHLVTRFVQRFLLRAPQNPQNDAPD